MANVDMSSTTELRPAGHELANFESGQWDEAGHDLQSLPRADGGKDAWLMLGACFIMEALIWGMRTRARSCERC